MIDPLPFQFCVEESSRTGVLLDVPERASLEEIETLLHTKLRPRLAPADLILLRFPPWTMREPKPLDKSESAGITRIGERFPHASVRILSSQNYCHLVGRELSRHCKMDLGIDSDSTDFLRNLRNHELWKMARDTNALMSSDNNYVFQLPSGTLSDRFLRVGNVQRDSHNLDTIFFWMIPYLKDAHGVVVDTWSIGSLALNCALRLKSYDQKRLHDLMVEMQGEYIDGRPITRSEIRRLAMQVSEKFRHPFLFLFSASMTGRSIKNTYSSLISGDCPPERVRLLVLFRVGNEKIFVEGEQVQELCAPPADQFGQHLPESFANRARIEINRATYFPTFVKEREVRLFKKFAKLHKGFFDRYRLSGSIRIHADSKVGGQTYRHHGIFVDVKSLLSQEPFRRKLKSRLQEIEGPPKVIIAPPHDAGEALAEFAAQHFEEIQGARPRVVIHLDLGLSEDSEPHEEGDHTSRDSSAVQEELTSFSTADTILVLDDVVTTGTRIRTYQKRLRDLRYEGAIDYLVGVQRMESRDKWRDLRLTLEHNSFGRNHTLCSVEDLVLPNWDEESCPLCIETTLLLELRAGAGENLAPWISDRLRLLQLSREKGLLDEIFFLWGGDSFELGPNSVFASQGSPQSIVLSSVAAAIQELRNDENSSTRLDPSGFPVRSVLSAKDFNRYTDGVLRASLLRSLEAAEIRHASPKAENELIEIFKSVFCSVVDDNVALQSELALAIGLGKVSDRAATSFQSGGDGDERSKGIIRLIEAHRA